MMNLGTETGSLINHVMSMGSITVPTVGMGVTLLGWSDRNPGTIYEVTPWKDGYQVLVRLDNYVRTDKNGMSECQEYEYTPDPDGASYIYRTKGDGKWFGVYFNTDTNRYNKLGPGYGLLIGHRERFYDFSF